jgi:hypothetical protein
MLFTCCISLVVKSDILKWWTNPIYNLTRHATQTAPINAQSGTKRKMSLRPLPVYEDLSLCRSVVQNILNKDGLCPYCLNTPTQFIPLSGSGLWICCLECYENFRVSYLGSIAERQVVDSRKEREKFILQFRAQSLVSHRS